MLGLFISSYVDLFIKILHLLFLSFYYRILEYLLYNYDLLDNNQASCLMITRPPRRN